MKITFSEKIRTTEDHNVVVEDDVHTCQFRVTVCRSDRGAYIESCHPSTIVPNSVKRKMRKEIEQYFLYSRESQSRYVKLIGAVRRMKDLLLMNY